MSLLASLSMTQSGDLIRNENGVTSRLVSNQPFSWRAESGAHDAFEHTALQELLRNPERPFYRTEQVQGRDVLRYAVAERMQSKCVACHNQHPASPKKDWKVGDVKAAMIITVPLTQSTALVRSGTRGTMLLMTVMGVIGVLAIALVLRQHRRDGERLQKFNMQLTAQKNELSAANDRLKSIHTASQERAAQLQDMQIAALNMMQDAESSRKHIERSNQELSREISDRSRLQSELEELKEEHLEIAREAGMAEVATGVLHNVGNVLNSVNVSTSLLSERVRGSRVENLLKATELLNEHHNDLSTWLSSSDAGQRLPGYLKRLARTLGQDRDFLLDELHKLVENIEHIKEIVQLQQLHARRGGDLEQIDLVEVVKSALIFDEASLRRHDIRIVRDFESVPGVLADKHRILQIVVNLISNAKNAMSENDCPERTLTIRVRRSGEHDACIEVQDTGIGIAAEDLDRIFSHGFTTRKNGHGFGLHSSANSAVELGGALSVSSDGIGCGTTFTLSIPLTEEATCLTH